LVVQVPFDWTPGLEYDSSEDLSPYLQQCPDREKVVAILSEAHDWLGQYTHDEVEESIRVEGGWATAFDMQPDKPFPERE
jgi:hypothetical protein